jgi:pimeloyl-ACP methyl ester carboxylesterase
MKFYALSGLGADRRVFRFLKLDVPIISLDWIPPLQNETLTHYAIRLSQCIDQRKPFGLIGLSFGGMIAAEMARSLNPEKTIIISSVVRSVDLPWVIRIARGIAIHEVLPYRWVNLFPGILSWFFSTNHKQLFGDILNDTDPGFLKWALGSIIEWQNEGEPAKYVRIHGDKDRLIPLKGKVDYIIAGGGHLMIVDKSMEVSEIINKLDELN